MPGIRLHQLEGFFHVARLGGYTKATQAFSYPIGQPAVYQQVRGLQEDLGLKLVIQAEPRRMELTPEGRALWHPSGMQAEKTTAIRWYRFAQPPATVYEPSGFTGFANPVMHPHISITEVNA